MNESQARDERQLAANAEANPAATEGATTAAATTTKEVITITCCGWECAAGVPAGL